MRCINCGEIIEGDGYTSVLYCPNALDDEELSSQIDVSEPDANPIYCSE